MKTLLALIPYFILGGVLVVLIVKLVRIKKPGGWSFVSVAGLAALLFSYYLLDSGRIANYRVNIGDKTFYVSTSAFEQFLTENLDKFANAFSRFYAKYYEVEVFDVTKESDRMRYGTTDNGALRYRLKLKAVPIINTIQVEPSAPSYMLGDPEGPFFSVDEDNWMFIDTQTKDHKGQKAYNKTIRLCFIVKYLRAPESDE